MNTEEDDMYVYFVVYMLRTSEQRSRVVRLTAPITSEVDLDALWVDLRDKDGGQSSTGFLSINLLAWPGLQKAHD